MENFLANSRTIPEFAQIYHHVYFKSMNGCYLAANDSTLFFLDGPNHDELTKGHYYDEHFLTDPIVLKQTVDNDKIVLKNKSVQIFTEQAICNKQQAAFLSVKAPLFGANDIIGICGISLMINGCNLSKFNDILNKIKHMLSDHTYDVSKLNSLNLNSISKIELTIRETECLSLYMKGYSANNIASILGLSNRTIEFYLENIKSKSGVNKRNELLPLAFAMYPNLG